MGSNREKQSENILVKVDQNNLMYIDPNSVISKKGEILPRGIDQENLVMFVNLEADLIPRSTLLATNDQNTMTEIVKGTLNFMSNGGNDFDSSWTNAYNGTDTPTKFDEKGKAIEFKASDTNYDATPQSFGIQSINITVKGANFVPQVQINFVDVRGKTLFESPENSAYKAFFHIPWPIFYLTVKGYYGKAIKYRLHLVKFSSKFNPTNGNFEVSTTFVGSTYAYMSDIPLKAALYAPFMYGIETVDTPQFNESTKEYIQKVSKSSRGYALLNSVYSEYKRKNLIPKDFPTKTLKEVGIIAKSLDKLLEKEIFDEVVDMKLFAALKEFGDRITSFENDIKSWARRNLSQTYTKENDVLWFELSSINKSETTNITGNASTTTLENLINNNKIKVKESQLLTLNVTNKTGTKFNTQTILSKNVGNVGDYYKIKDTKVVVSINELINDIGGIRTTFNQQKQKLQDFVEQKMNTIVKRNGPGTLGFEPTVRNVFAIILANAEVYIKLMKDVHRRAIDIGQDRKKKIQNFSKESKGESIYPWPEIKKNFSNGKQNIIAYPGDAELVSKLESNNPVLWPEVEFIENYIGITTNRYDPLGNKEQGANNISYIFEGSDFDETKIKPISTLLNVNGSFPYTDKTHPALLYEIWERSKYATLIDSFNNTTVQELARREFDNIKESIQDDDDLLGVLYNNVKSDTDLEQLLPGVSVFDRYPYKKDNIPTTPAILDAFDFPFSIKQYTNESKTVSVADEYAGLTENLKTFTGDGYRTNIYPFNTSTYLSYINKTSFDINELNTNGVLSLNLQEGFICSPIDGKSWVKSEYVDNLFGQYFKIKNKKTETSTSILNTSFFHKQLHSDFIKSSPYGKFASSAYYLLNSLPFKDLTDEIDFNGKKTRMSTMFRELGSTHFIPYYQILRWGSIYHRYKTYINVENIGFDDILKGSTYSGSTYEKRLTDNINTQLFFGVSGETPTPITGFTYTDESSTSVTINYNDSVGVHPFYDAVYHQIVKGINHYVVSGGTTAFQESIDDKVLRISKRNVFDKTKFITQFVDNSQFGGNGSDKTYTILPCDGANLYSGKKVETFNTETATVLGTSAGSADISGNNFATEEQLNFRVIWSDDTINNSYSGITLPSHEEYFTTTGNTYENGDYKKVLDLIATFNSDILDEFENIFLNFASERLEEELPYKTFNKVNHYKFQDLLQSILTVDKKAGDDSLPITELVKEIKERQVEKLKQTTKDLLVNDSLIKVTLGNPKEINPHVFDGFCDISTGNTFSYDRYYVNQSTGNDGDINRDYLKLYLGPNKFTDVEKVLSSSITGLSFYEQFFIVNDVEFSPDNVKLFRPIIQLYAGWANSGYTANPTGFTPTSNNFKTHLRTLIFDGDYGSKKRQTDFLQILIPLFSGLRTKQRTSGIKIDNGYNNETLKLEIYNHFKSFNDKWVAGNSIGQRTLLEEFLFLDKANRDIGDRVFLNLDKLIDLTDEKNGKLNLYGALGSLIAGTGFDMRALPAYVNFYGSNFSNKTKITPSKTVAKNLFGTFLEVDYQESAPKIVVQYVDGPVSKRPSDMGEKYKFQDDSFNIGNVNNNSLIITTPDVFNAENLAKSNKVVAFEVSVGDQNQGIFKSIQLDQATLKNTSESFVVLENLARSESGAGTYNVDIGLFDYYRQASYSCEVTCMGNVMIQPTMFFYLKNVPMFRGSYWITEVSHQIRGTGIETVFKGTRLPSISLPDPKDSFISSYRTLFDKIMNRAVAKINELNTTTKTSEIVITPQGSFVIDKGEKQISGEETIKEAGVDEFGIPYNGAENEKFIQKVKFRDKDWYRAVAVEMGTEKYPIPDDTTMSVVNLHGTLKQIKWSGIKGNGQKYYSTKFIPASTNAKYLLSNQVETVFLNPEKPDTPITLGHNVNQVLENDAVKYDQSTFQGPINIGPNVTGYGIGLSKKLMDDLGVYPGGVLYFRIKKK
jgi:hypothetical protein